MSKDFPVLGYDIGGTKIAVCLGSSNGQIIASRRIDSARRNPDKVVPEMVQIGQKLLADAGLDQAELAGIGIGAPGPMDVATGIMLPSPNMKSWGGVKIRDIIADEFNTETFLDNDANAGVVAEWFFGAGKGCKNLIYLTMSTGIGGGVIVNGHLMQGADFLAAELGHIILDIDGPDCNCGLKGCFEAFCGGRAIAQRMQRELVDQPGHLIIQLAGSLDEVDYIALEEATRQKNPYALALWDEIALRNAQALGCLATIFNPEMIILGTVAWAAEDLFMDPVKKYFPNYCWPEMQENLTLTVSALGREIGEYAGICVALNALYEKGQWQLPWKSGVS